MLTSASHCHTVNITLYLSKLLWWEGQGMSPVQPILLTLDSPLLYLNPSVNSQHSSTVMPCILYCNVICSPRIFWSIVISWHFSKPCAVFQIWHAGEGKGQLCLYDGSDQMRMPHSWHVKKCLLPPRVDIESLGRKHGQSNINPPGGHFSTVLYSYLNFLIVFFYL